MDISIWCIVIINTTGGGAGGREGGEGWGGREGGEGRGGRAQE